MIVKLIDGDQEVSLTIDEGIALFSSSVVSLTRRRGQDNLYVNALRGAIGKAAELDISIKTSILHFDLQSEFPGMFDETASEEK